MTILLSIFTLLMTFVTPEQFGASSNGTGDASPALNACIRSGVPIRLKKDGVYTLRSRLERIHGSFFEMDGCGAMLVIDSAYPVAASDIIFGFENDFDRRALFSVKNLIIRSHLGPKFSDPQRRGDTYLFYIGNCDKAEFLNVDVEDYGKYNNLSLIVNAGANMNIRNCRMVSRSRSVQGGALWVMNKYREKLRLVMKNVDIDYDTHDECLCLAIDAAAQIPSMRLRADIASCRFRSATSVDNPGFVILYSHSARIVPDIEAVFRNCSFETKGGFPKRVMAFQSTCSPSVPDNNLSAEFRHCSFVIKPALHSDTGLFWMPQLTPETTPEQYRMRFVNSTVDVSNVCSIIGDKNGETCGTLEFKSCRVNTDGELFVRQYNPGAGRLTVRTIGSEMKCSGKYVTTERLESKRSVFKSETVSEMQHLKR